VYVDDIRRHPSAPAATEQTQANCLTLLKLAGQLRLVGGWGIMVVGWQRRGQSGGSLPRSSSTGRARGVRCRVPPRGKVWVFSQSVSVVAVKDHLDVLAGPQLTWTLRRELASFDGGCEQSPQARPV
jgi:hypothetical protein